MLNLEINKVTDFAGSRFDNKIVAASSPLTESLHRLECCEKAGFGAAILKSCADYISSGSGYPRRVLNTNDGFYADGSFESEIHTLEKGISLYEQAVEKCKNMLLIPSVTAMSLDIRPWLDICRQFHEKGAGLIQLDLFYLGTLIQDECFYERLDNLMSHLTKEKYVVMPKLNINLNAEKVCSLLKKNGIYTVSLLDSIRMPAPDYYGLHSEGTSFFGGWQLKKSVEFLKVAKKHDLEVCAGGGITNKEDMRLMLNEGATLLQIASVVLKNGFLIVTELLDEKVENSMKEYLKSQKTWCDFTITGICTGCGGCVFT